MIDEEEAYERNQETHKDLEANEDEERISELYSELEAIGEDLDTLRNGGIIPEVPDETVESLLDDRDALFQELNKLEAGQ